MKANRLRARQALVESLQRAMVESNSTQRAVARMVEVTPITVHRWLRSETPINVEAVLGCPSLAKAFKRELCGEHHSDPLPGYVAKRRGAK